MKKSFEVTPWEVKGDVDYERLVREFGLEKINENILKGRVGFRFISKDAVAAGEVTLPRDI